MSIAHRETTTVRPVHPWLRKIRVALVPGPTTSLLEKVASDLLHHFRLQGHEVQEIPDDRTDVLMTTTRFGEPVSWRKALLFNARRRFNLSCLPTIYTLVHATSAEFQRLLDHFQTVLKKESPAPADYDFPGLSPQAYQVLFEQGHRGGPILTLERLVQVQAMSLKVLLVLGDDRPLTAYHFDLIGAHPRSEADDLEFFFDDIVLRIVTTESTREVTEHEVAGNPISRDLWQRLSTPAAMCTAGRRMGERHFFTKMVYIANLVQVPVVPDTVAEQYSEGCFATWDPILGGLIATATGSARPIYKGNISEDDLTVIVGVRPDDSGVLVRHVEGKLNISPSTEAVEMMGMDSLLPTITLGPAWGTSVQVPVVRSKLHGHRGIAAYDPDRVEYVTLDPPYYHYLVTCGTDAQARGVEQAFARSEALQNPDDPRQVVFTVLPGHGTFVVEKWVPGKAPFQTIWEYMDAGYLQVETRVPQGTMEYAPGPDGRMLLQTA